MWSPTTAVGTCPVELAGPFWEVIVKQPTIDAAGPDAMSEDLGALTGAIGAAGIDTSGVAFVCSPREAAIIKTKVGPKFDYPVLSTLGLPAKTVACASCGRIRLSGHTTDRDQQDSDRSP